MIIERRSIENLVRKMIAKISATENLGGALEKKTTLPYLKSSPPTNKRESSNIFEYQIFLSLTSNNFTQNSRSNSLAIKSNSTLVFLIQRWWVMQKPTTCKSLPIHHLLTDIFSKILLSSTLQKNIKQPQLKSVLLDV